VTETKGHCKHGEFTIRDGCPQCVAERRAAGIRPEQDEMEGGLNSEGLTLAGAEAKPERIQEEFTGVPFGEGVVATSSEGPREGLTMTLEEAIEVLHEDLGADIYDAHPYFYKAQRLGIEGLKWVQKERPDLYGKYPPLLPGETED